MTKVYSEAILKFLLSKQWVLEAKKEPFYWLAPPSGMEFLKTNFKYRVPIHEHYEGYDDYIHNLVISISDLYEMDRSYLFDLFSHAPQESKEDIALRASIVAA